MIVPGNRPEQGGQCPPIERASVTSPDLSKLGQRAPLVARTFLAESPAEKPLQTPRCAALPAGDMDKPVDNGAFTKRAWIDIFEIAQEPRCFRPPERHADQGTQNAHRALRQ